MKVMIVISNAEMGGAQKVSINLAKWLKNNTTSSVHIVALTKAIRQIYDMRDIQFTVLKSKGISKQLRQMIKKEKIDILLSMGVPLALYTVPACIGTSAKHIISERNDPAHFSGKVLTRIVSRLLMRMASGFVFQTKEAQLYYGNSIVERSRVIPNPLFNVETMPNVPFQGKRKKVIVSVGRLNKQKNQKMLIEAFAELEKDYPDYKLMIWGEGPERENLENLIEKLDIESKVELPGTTNRILEEIYRDSIFVMTSDFEGMPNALMEAMALGLPCISTDCPCGGAKELIQDNNNGMLIPTRDKDALKHKIIELLENQAIAKILGENAIKIRKTHSLEQICGYWLDYFEIVYKRI